MKRFPILGVLLLIPALLLVGLVGCTSSKDKDKDKDKTTVVTGGEKTGGKKTKETITTALDATVTGTVKFKGKAPEMKPIDALLKHTDYKAVCSKGETTDQTWHVGADGAVANVIIILGPPADKKFDTSDKVKELSKLTRVIDQPFCQYMPHVVGLYQDAQTVMAKNSSTVSHNVKITNGGAADRDVNLSPSKDTGEIKFSELNNETLVNAGCSIHTFMQAKIAVFNHPYFGVTDDKGKFEIKNVPIDTELTVYMWHESMGGLKSKVEQKKMTFKKGDNSLGELEIK